MISWKCWFFVSFFIHTFNMPMLLFGSWYSENKKGTFWAYPFMGAQSNQIVKMWLTHIRFSIGFFTYFRVRVLSTSIHGRSSKSKCQNMTQSHEVFSKFFMDISDCTFWEYACMGARANPGCLKNPPAYVSKKSTGSMVTAWKLVKISYSDVKMIFSSHILSTTGFRPKFNLRHLGILMIIMWSSFF